MTSVDLTMLPSTTVELDEAAKAKSVLRVIDALEEHDDVQNVYANFDIPDDVLAVRLRTSAAPRGDRRRGDGGRRPSSQRPDVVASIACRGRPSRGLVQVGYSSDDGRCCTLRR